MKASDMPSSSAFGSAMLLYSARATPEENNVLKVVVDRKTHKIGKSW
jgi:hypothetical protein